MRMAVAERFDEVLASGDRRKFRALLVEELETPDRGFAVARLLSEAARVERLGEADLHADSRMLASRMTRYLDRAKGVKDPSLAIELLMTSLVHVHESAIRERAWNLQDAVDVVVDLWYPVLAGPTHDTERGVRRLRS